MKSCEVGVEDIHILDKSRFMKSEKMSVKPPLNRRDAFFVFVKFGFLQSDDFAGGFLSGFVHFAYDPSPTFSSLSKASIAVFVDSIL
ncbi:hypothetical protein L1987_79011 [Smallanthus sonchifolius]|uniref:Uncharacterized protein n=1 Tax=Smallanthus sonchifolius TaxID=185202 RepID=A0ACB8ZE79_9ASTR|nr:hypothetical protein L1987_79011 [Smallanthus sonchifolius]